MSTIKKLVVEEPAEAPPPDWSPLDASDKDLQKYIYPPRPDRSTEPLAYASWEEFARQKPKYVAAGPVEISGNLPDDDRQSWTGAVVPKSVVDTNHTPAEEGQRIDRVEGRWKVPTVKAKEEDGQSVDGDYELWTWVGIDGFLNSFHIRAGVETTFRFKQPNHRIDVKHTAFVALRYDLGKPTKWEFSKFFVSTGDEVHVHVWGDVTATAPINATIFNKTRDLWSSVDTGSQEQLKGSSAQWILSGPKTDSKLLFPAFDNVVYSNLSAHQEDGTEIRSEDSALTISEKIPVKVSKFVPSRLLFEYVPTSQDE